MPLVGEAFSTDSLAISMRGDRMKCWSVILALLTAILSSAVLANNTEKPGYEIINVTKMPGVKCSINVRLSRKATESELKDLATEIRKSQTGKYERFFILYYLPGMEVGSLAWATTHFNPDLKIEIQGMTSEQEKSLIQAADSTGKECIGTWIDETPFISNTTSLIRKGDKVLLIMLFKDGSKVEQEMTETQTSQGTKFEEKGGNSFGEYYLLGKDGILRSFDSDGQTSTMKPAIKKRS
jgi:hypothetical protein